MFTKLMVYHLLALLHLRILAHNYNALVYTVYVPINSYTYMHTYCIAGKFSGENVWQIYSFQAFGGKKFGK